MELNQEMNALLEMAVSQKASDIYFLPAADQYQIKIRLIDKTILWDQIKVEHARRLMNYCKYLADMALSETRRPQTGAMNWKINELSYSLRLSSVGNFEGRESLVIRLIYQLPPEEKAFFNPSMVERINQLSKRRGLIVFSGPTGSGKTTTIYNLIRSLVREKVIMTIEDPVEIKVPDYLQLQVNEEAEMTYAALVKSGLRHRPDVFVIGEIRDEITAQAAVKAALSGHLVYTTVHAQSPLGVISRLSQLGIQPAFLSQTLTAVGYQRLLPTTDNGHRALLMVHDYSELCTMKTYGWREWVEELKQAVNQHQITAETATKFRFG